MIRNYFKMALRNLGKNRVVAFINIVGLALGLAICLLIGLWTRHELQFDAFHEKGDRVVLFQQFENNAGSGSGFAPLLAANISQIEKTARLAPTKALLATQDEVYHEDYFYFADTSVFEVLTLPLVAGQPKGALTTPYGVLISAHIASKYFPGQDPIGQTIRFDNKRDLQITGILKELPDNAHLKIDFLCAFEHAEELLGEGLDGFWDNRSLTYLLLSEGTVPAGIAAQLAAIKAKSNDQNAGAWQLGLIPLQDIYLYHTLDGRVKANKAIDKVYLFSAIALFVLVLACFNYINLATARASMRAKEVGVRKTIGASRAQLFWQFLSESFVNIMLAAWLSLAIALLLLPYFNRLAETNLSLEPLFNAPNAALALGGLLMLCLLTGSYPSLTLSAFNPVDSLKNKIYGRYSGAAFRKVLVVGQFAVSITILVATFIVLQQLHYMQNKELGYQQEQILTIAFPGKTTPEQRLLLKQKLENMAGVQQVSLSSSLPGSGSWFNKLVVDYLPAGSKDAGIQQLFVDEDFLTTFNIELAAGRNFRIDEHKRGPVYMINEAAMQYLQWKEIEGRQIGYYSYEYSPEGGYKEVPLRGPVVGVVKDYHQVNLKSTIAPLLIVMDPAVGSQMAVKLQPGNLKGQIAGIEQQWQEIFSDRPFEFSFLDDAFTQTYKAEIRSGKVMSIFAGFAIVISCMGLFGLATFTTEQRTKEIGIRKLLGASVTSIVTILSKDFLKLVLIANLVAWPLAWWGMHQWLEGFAYRIDLPWWLFIAAAVLAGIVAFITIGYQAFKAATANPVKNLRTE